MFLRAPHVAFTSTAHTETLSVTMERLSARTRADDRAGKLMTEGREPLTARTRVEERYARKPLTARTQAADRTHSVR
jgi:hypothetical protein